MRARLVVIALSAIVVAACAPGTPDTGYSPSGSVPYGAGIGGPRSLVATADGGVIATGSSARPLTRISATGVVDAAWGSTLPNNCRNTSTAVGSGSGVLFACARLAAPGGPQVWQVWRVTSGGALDPAFGGGDGIVDIPNTINELQIAALPNGGYLGLGYATLPPSTTSVAPLVAMSFSAAGALVNTTQINIPLPPISTPIEFDWFISARLVSTPTGVAAFERLSAVIRNNGLEAVYTRVQKFDANGAVADSPELIGPPVNNGPSGGPVGFYSIPAFVSLGDGRTAAIATATFILSQAPDPRVSLVQVIGSNGAPAPAFGEGGIVRLVLANGTRLDPQALAVTNGGRYLVVVGIPNGGGAPLVARYEAHTGALDPKFGNGGRAGVALTAVDSAVARTGFDQLYLGGADTTRAAAIARIWGHVVP